jgi:hypothetical protein
MDGDIHTNTHNAARDRGESMSRALGRADAARLIDGYIHDVINIDATFEAATDDVGFGRYVAGGLRDDVRSHARSLQDALERALYVACNPTDPPDVVCKIDPPDPAPADPTPDQIRDAAREIREQRTTNQGGGRPSTPKGWDGV